MPTPFPFIIVPENSYFRPKHSLASSISGFSAIKTSNPFKYSSSSLGGSSSIQPSAGSTPSMLIDDFQVVDLTTKVVDTSSQVSSKVGTNITSINTNPSNPFSGLYA